MLHDSYEEHEIADAAYDYLTERLAEVCNPWHHDFRVDPPALYQLAPGEWRQQQRALITEALDLLEAYPLVPPPGLVRNFVFYPDLLQHFLSRETLQIHDSDWAGMLERCLELPGEWAAPALTLLLCTHEARPQVLQHTLPGMAFPKLLAPARIGRTALYEQARRAGFPDPYLEDPRLEYRLPWPLPDVGEYRAAYHRALYAPATLFAVLGEAAQRPAVRQALLDLHLSA